MSVPPRLKRAARSGVRWAAATSDRVLKPQEGITLLGYHQVGGPRSGGVNLTADMFDRQLAYLTDRTRVISLDEAVARLEGHTPRTVGHDLRPFVVITFDDGTADFVDVALPLLEHYDVPATLYLATSYPEQSRSFWDDGTVLSWSALAEAVSTGLVEVGSHTHNHALLDRTVATVIDDELDRSIDLIGSRLGVKATHFAYPKALGHGLQGDVAVRQRFRSAAVAGGGTNRVGRSNLFRLRRQPVLAADDLEVFARKSEGGLRLEGMARDRLDRYRYRDASR